MPPWPNFPPWHCLDSQLPSNTDLSLLCHNDESGRTLRLRTTCTVFPILTWKRASRHFLKISTSKSALNVVCVLTILTWKCASLLNISISKSAPKLKCFVHLDVETYFAPQRCAPFPNLNFQKSEPHHHCWQGPVPRLMIRQIVLENFKSYGGVKVQGWDRLETSGDRRWPMSQQCTDTLWMHLFLRTTYKDFVFHMQLQITHIAI